MLNFHGEEVVTDIYAQEPVGGEEGDSWRGLHLTRVDATPLRGDGGDIGNHRKKDGKGELLEHRI